MYDNIIPIKKITTQDIDPDLVLGQAIGNVKSAIIIGWDKNDEMYFASSIADGGDILWLMEFSKKRLLEEGEI